MFQTRTQAPPEGARLALELIGLRQDIDRLELRFSQVAVAYDKTEHWDQEGSNSAIDWIRFNCRMTSTAAADRLAVGKRLDQMAQSQQAPHPPPPPPPPPPPTPPPPPPPPPPPHHRHPPPPPPPPPPPTLPPPTPH